MRYIPALMLLLALAPTAAGASPILINGSFEGGPPPFSENDIDIPAGSDGITAGAILHAGVDLLEDPWAVSDGTRAIDLDRRSPGGVEQTFSTRAERRYQLLFDLSGNPEGGPTVKQLLVSVGDVSQAYLF